MLPACPRCGLEFERRESGYVVGAYMLNIVAAELVVVIAGLAVVIATWPEPPWAGLTYGGAALVVLLPLLFYPVSKTLFLAMDLAIRPKDHE